MKTTRLGIICLLSVAGALSSGSAQASVFTTLYGGEGGAQGVLPTGTLISRNGILYGVTASGGEANQGTVFSFDLAASKQTVLYSFKGGAVDGAQPVGPLVEIGGKLYGMTTSGGTSGGGAVFEFDLKSGSEKLIRSMDMSADGAAPYAGLTEHKGALYGTTSQGGANGSGTLFALDPKTGAERVVHAFGFSDGYLALGPIIFSGDYIYGTNSSGGDFWAGDVFRIDPATGDETVLYSFTGRPGGLMPVSLIEYGGSLYGEAEAGGSLDGGLIFKIDLASGIESTVHEFGGYPSDGSYPLGGLIVRNGVMYGTTQSGGFPGGGTIFSIDLSSGKESLLYDFYCYTDGCVPFAGLLDLQGVFYGTSQASWVYPGGVIYSFKRIGSARNGERVVHSFNVTDGAYPTSALINGGDGFVYGTTTGGGANDGGTVYQMARGGAVKVLYSFSTGDGGAPNAIAMASSTALLGTIAAGGSAGSGSIVKLTTAGEVSVLHSFNGADGAAPNSIVADGDGVFYGTTSSGGANGLGTVFRITANGTLTVLHSFAGAEGSQPYGSFIKGADGNFYGTTFYGGDGDFGTVFKITPAGRLTSLHSFNYDRSAGGLVYGDDDNLYGTTVSSYGAVYRISPDGTNFSYICTFGPYTSTCGWIAGVSSAIAYGSDGNLYVGGGYGGPTNGGGISQLSPVTGIGTTIYNVGGSGVLIEREPGLLLGTFGAGLYGVGSLMSFLETPPQ